MNRSLIEIGRRLFVSALLLVSNRQTACAQEAPSAPPADAAPVTTMFAHPDDSRWWLSGQVNLISQSHGRFTSPYHGDNSLRPDPSRGG